MRELISGIVLQAVAGGAEGGDEHVALLVTMLGAAANVVATPNPSVIGARRANVA